MKAILLEILKDCDEDIRTKLLERDGKHEVWEYLENAALTALMWQQVRNSKRNHESV
jgi:hypothetical protein